MQTLNENLGENLGKNLYDNIKYFISSKKPQFTQSEFSKATTFYLSSPYRSANIGTTELAQSIIKFSVLKRIFQEAKEMGAQGDIDFLDAKISFNSGLCEHEFPRDCAFLVGEKLFFPSVKFKEIYKDERLVSREIMLDEIRHSQRFAHLNFQELPFYLEGGNVIVTDLRTDCGERVILFSLSDLNFSGQKYNGSYFLDDRGNVSRIDDIDHAEHMIAKYFKHIGINAIAIRRNLSRHSINDLYHLDTFVNAICDCVIIPEEDLITQVSREELLVLFKGKCIFINSKERSMLGSNVINLENFVIFTSKDTPKSLIEKFNQMGFNCALPPIDIAVAGNDGLRCATIEIPVAVKLSQTDKSRK